MLDVGSSRAVLLFGERLFHLQEQPMASQVDFQAAFPNSRKVFVDGTRGVHVPVREISLSGGEPPLRVYDTSGPQGFDVHLGLPKLREDWVLGRGDVEPAAPAQQLAS